MIKPRRRLLILFAVLLIVFGGFLYRDGVACGVEGAVRSARVDESLNDIHASAKARVEEKFGKMAAQPIVVSATSPMQLFWYIGNDYGKTIFTPVQTCVVLGKIGSASVDIAAHELVHAEIVERIGFLRRLTKFPVWLDEGLAMQVDYRPQYDVTKFNGVVLPELTALENTAQFYSGDDMQITLHYAVAKAEAARWLQENGGSAKLFQRLQSITADFMLLDNLPHSKLGVF